MRKPRRSIAPLLACGPAAACALAGALTRVSKGSVSVRDLCRERTVILDAGESYPARSGR